MTGGVAGGASGLADPFVRDNLPPPAARAVRLAPPGAPGPERLNAARALLSDRIAEGGGGRTAVLFAGRSWTYGEIDSLSDRIAAVLVEDMGLVPGNRVLLRAPNTPMLVACWFAVLKAGGICVATMPLLRARELAAVIAKARIRHALCHESLAGELRAACGDAGEPVRVALFTAAGDGAAELDRAAAAKPPGFPVADTAASDPAIVAFTSGTTGRPKGCVHGHGDLLAICDCFPPHVLGRGRDDVVTGSPPVAFAFGLGAFVCFPFRVGAAVALIDRPSPAAILDAVERHRCTVLYAAPTAFRAMTDQLGGRDVSSLRRCVSAGEALPRPVFEAWRAATGLEIVDGIGSTEMLHIFVSGRPGDIRPGATGRAVPGYEAKVIAPDGGDAAPDEVGRLAVRGPTGCAYLADPERQAEYVRDGWNLTGDLYRRDGDGYFWYVSRADDLIVSAGYNIAGPEVEAALLGHSDVAECGVVGVPDPERGQIVAAFVVPREGAGRDAAAAAALQDYVKKTIAPYKYPRSVTFVDALPRTETGKLQRFRLRGGAA